jgi:hypothetical protein
MIDDNLERTFQQVWRLHGVTYVPHYTKPDVYVGPGRTPPEYTLLQLIGAGAVSGEMFLWAR